MCCQWLWLGGIGTHYDMKMTIILPRKTISLYMYSLGDMLLSRLATLTRLNLHQDLHFIFT